MVSEDDWKSIQVSLNLLSLRPTLIERQLLSLTDPFDLSSTDLLTRVRDGGKEEEFRSCFVTGKRYEHLGHEYIAFLLHGRGSFADQEILRLSSRYEATLIAKMSQVAEVMCVLSLVPHLREKRLLTTDEAIDLSQMSTSNGGSTKPIWELLRILKSKGPTAFMILVECIHDEKQHRGHKELYRLLTEDHPLPSPKPAKPSELRYGDELTSRDYIDRRHQFEKHYHSGNWEACAKLAQDCMDSAVPEDRVVGQLELALSYVFHIDEGNVLKHVRVADGLCKHIENFHRTFLLGRCKYLLALLYHYLNQPALAKTYIAEAKDILFGVEIGEDKSFAAYCDAIISSSTLTDKSSSFEFSQVIQKFETSLHFSSNSYDLDILTIYSYLRLGRLYLGRTETKIARCADQTRIQMARDCQLKLKSDFYSVMDDRCKALYHLTEFDISITTGEESSYAQRVLDAAEMYVQRSKCSPDEVAVQVRRRELEKHSQLVAIAAS